MLIGCLKQETHSKSNFRIIRQTWILKRGIIFELDLFETPKNTINILHDRGVKVICYFNAGAWEEFRPDANAFPEEVIGNPYIGWPGERWLDIRRFVFFEKILTDRMDLAVAERL